MTEFAFGADEAGRGPAIGSMFAAAVAAEPAALPDGLADSKTLTPDRRETLANRLESNDGVRVGVAEIPPDRIDDPATDMNSLTVIAQARAAEAVVDGGERGIVDACDTDEERFARRLTDEIGGEVSIVAEHGADDAYRLPAAASIVAKVERDAHVAELSERYGDDVGSGYPGDSTTTKFLSAYVADHGELPSCARTSWTTCDRILDDAGQQELAEF